MRIIAAFSGVGKSYYCKQNPKAVDFVVMPYKYSNFYEVAVKAEGESIKAHGDLLLRENWQNVYFDALMEAYRREPDKVFVIPTVDYVLFRLKVQGIPFLLVYPHRDLKEVYRQRYIDRGNTQEFLDVFIGDWDNWMDTLRSHGGTHMELLKDVYLSDVLPDAFSGLAVGGCTDG